MQTKRKNKSPVDSRGNEHGLWGGELDAVGVREFGGESVGVTFKEV